PASIRPPGNEISPAWRDILSLRRVNTSRGSSVADRIGTNTAPGLVSGIQATLGAGSSSGASRSRMAQGEIMGDPIVTRGPDRSRDGRRPWPYHGSREQRDIHPGHRGDGARRP